MMIILILEDFCPINNNANYILKLKCSSTFHPNVIIDYGGNKAYLPTFKLKNINSLKIFANCYEIPASGTIDYNDLSKILFNNERINTKKHISYK